MDLEKLETLKLYRGATSVIELDFTGFNFESNSYCQLTIKKKYNDDIVFQHDFKKPIKYYVTFKDEFTVGLDDNDYKYDIMYMLKDERYPQCSISDVIIDEVLNDYKGEFDAKAVQVTEVLTEGAEITQSIKVTNSNVIIVSSNLQERTITPTKEEQVILAEEGFDGMSKVVVEAIPDKYIIPNLQDKEARVTAPTNIFVHPDEGYDGLAFVNVIATVDAEQVEVTPTKEEQVLTPSEDKYIDSVTVNPIPDEYIIPSGELEITKNGSYDVTDKESINVDIQPNLGTKTITENGTYNASDEGLDGYSNVEVTTSGVDINEYIELNPKTTSAGSGTLGYWYRLIKKIPKFENTQISTSYFFQGFYGTEIEGIEDCDFSKNSGGTDNKNFTKMFYQCSNLTHLKLNKWDMSNVTNISYMFSTCSALANLEIDEWSVNNVTDMSNLFNGCKKLTMIDLNKWNVSEVTTLLYTFSGCSALASLNIKNWDVSKVTTLNSAFQSCSSLKELDLSGWVTSNVTNTAATFAGCTSLQKLDIRNFDFSKVTTTMNMFGRDGTYVPADCEIIVKDDAARNWVLNVKNDFTNVKTVAELGA